jgi:RNA polymerase sigma-70 factor (ECF subfamily)
MCPVWGDNSVHTCKDSDVPNPSDFPPVYRRFLPAVRTKCRRILAQTEDAEDVAHESFVRLLQSGPAWSSEADTPVLMAWLYRTCTRLAIDTLRSRRHTAPLADSDVSDDDAAPCWWPGGIELDSAIAARRLVGALCGSVGEEELESAILCRVDGLSQVDAGAVLGVSERTVRRWLDRFDEHVASWRQEYMS